MTVEKIYKELAVMANSDLKSRKTGDLLNKIIAGSLEVVANSTITPLVSKVPNKSYSMATLGKCKSRPFNAALFAPTLPLKDMFDIISGSPPPVDPTDLDKALYTAAMAFPLAADLGQEGNKKSPGTYFETLIGHIFAARYNVNPRKSITAPTLDIELTIPTDFIFELPNQRRIHLPVKISTRERVVQVWAHQRMLDGMHGTNRFKGILVCLTETNKQKDVSVVEVCLPNQWAAYQMYIGELKRIYYLDPPARYIALRDTYPNIQVWPLSKFFAEMDTVIL